MKKGSVLFVVFALLFFLNVGQASCGLSEEIGVTEEGTPSGESIVNEAESVLVNEEDGGQVDAEVEYAHLGEVVCKVTLDEGQVTNSGDYDPSMVYNEEGSYRLSPPPGNTPYTLVVQNQGSEPLAFRVGFDTGSRKGKNPILQEITTGELNPGKTQVFKILLKGTNNVFYLFSRKEGSSSILSYFRGSPYIAGSKGKLIVYKTVAEQ